MIYCNLTHKEEDLWNATLLYRAKIREGSCQDEPYIYDAPFKYDFSNETRKITEVKEAHEDWDMMGLHPAFFSGTNPNIEEKFFVPEMMLLLGESGIMERSFELKSNESEITLSESQYKAFKFQVNTSMSLSYYDS